MQHIPSKCLPEDLRELRDTFGNWRLSKKNRAEQVPPHLWEMVRSLFHKHPIPTVISVAGVNKDMAIKYFALTAQQAPVNSPEIVEVANPIRSQKQTKYDNSFQLLIQHSKGHQLSVSADKELAYGAIRSFME